MLVLSRERDGSIVIGDDPDIAKNIVITIVDIRGGKVRIGIDCPRNVAVHRKEIYLTIQKEKEQAAQQPEAPKKE